MALAWAAHHWKYCFREQRSLVTFTYNCAHIVPRNLVNRVIGAHFLFIVLKQRNHEVNLPLARPHCPAMAGRRRAWRAGRCSSKYRSQMAGAEMAQSVPVRPESNVFFGVEICPVGSSRNICAGGGGVQRICSPAS